MQPSSPMPGPPAPERPHARFALPTTCRICRRWADAALCTDCLGRWAAPKPRCTRCAIAVPTGATAQVCGDCLHAPPAFERILVLADYGFPWDRLIARLKFAAEPEWAAVLAAPLARRIRELEAAAGVDCVIPVPLAPQRLRERGYNQAWALARHLARALGLPACDRWLTRFRHTDAQTALGRDQRRANLRHAFGVEQPGAVARRHCVLVDDVVTTGATADSAAQALMAAGAKQVDVWAIARTPAS